MKRHKRRAEADGTGLKELALISEPQVLRKILLHLGLPADLPPVAPTAHRDVEQPLFDEDAASAAPARSPP